MRYDHEHSLQHKSMGKGPLRHTLRMFLLLLMGTMLSPLMAEAQSRFAPIADRTGSSATVIIPFDAVAPGNAVTLEPGDEIGIFNQDGTCVGASTWTGENLAVTIWGNNDMTEGIDGLQANEPLVFKVWKAQSDEILTDESLDITLASDRPFYRTEKTYAPNAVYVVESILIQQSEASN